MDIGVYEAKSRFSDLIERVRQGDKVVITRHGEPIAELVPAKPAEAASRARLLREVRSLAARVRIPRSVSIRKLIAQGRD